MIMLALSRKRDESLIIDNNIEVTILDIRGDQVKIGINAPKEIPIYRKEVYLQIQEANKQAMETSSAEELKKMFSDLSGLSADEKNRIVKEVVEEMTWDGETLFLRL